MPRNNHQDEKKIKKKSEKKVIRKSHLRNSSEEMDLTLRDHYEVIRQDLLKLKNDLQKSYDTAKILVEKKGLWGQFLKSK